MNRFRVVQIGTGHPHAAGIFGAARNMPDVFEVLGIADPERTGALRTNAAYRDVPEYSVEDLLGLKPDGVFIETSEPLLDRFAEIALRAGCPVFVDKPGSEDHESYRRAVLLAKEKGLAFQTGYMYRFNPAVRDALERLDRGELGDVFSLAAEMSIRMGSRSIEKYRGGMMYFLGCHLADLALTFMGEPEEVLPLNVATGIDGCAVRDCGMAVLRYPRGIAYLKTSANEWNGFLHRRLTVSGEKATAELRPIERFLPEDTSLLETALEWTPGSGAPHPNFDGAQRFTYPCYHRYDEMLLNFVRVVRGEIRTRWDYDYEIALHSLVLRVSGLA